MFHSTTAPATADPKHRKLKAPDAIQQGSTDQKRPSFYGNQDASSAALGRKGDQFFIKILAVGSQLWDVKAATYCGGATLERRSHRQEPKTTKPQ